MRPSHALPDQTPREAPKADLAIADLKVFRPLMEAIPGGLAVVDRQGFVLAWNPAAEKITGLDRTQVIGTPCHTVFNCPNHAGACPLTHPGGLAAGPACVDTVLQTVGRTIHLQKTAVYLQDEAGRITGAIESFVDLTRERESRAALNEAHELLESARRAKRHFMANMSHEIRTPLNGILGMLSLLSGDENTTPAQREHLSCARRSAKLLMNLIDDVLDFTIIEKGALKIESTGFSLRSIIASVIARQYDLTRNKAVSIHTHVQDEVPDNLLGDSGRLYQILKHLVGNAIKFTPAGEVTVHVAPAGPADHPAAAAPRAIPLHFAISDTGVGIPRDKLGHIFDAMRQVDESSTRTFGGLGIGLNIVHRLIGFMEGRIWMESQPGQGTSVHFILTFRTIPNCEQAPCAAQMHDDSCSGGFDHTAAAHDASSQSDRGPGGRPNLAGRYKTLQALIATAPQAAEQLIVELRAAAAALHRDDLAAQLLRLLLALRRGDAQGTRKYMQAVNTLFTSVPEHSGGGQDEDPDSGR